MYLYSRKKQMTNFKLKPHPIPFEEGIGWASQWALYRIIYFSANLYQLFFFTQWKKYPCFWYLFNHQQFYRSTETFARTIYARYSRDFLRNVIRSRSGISFWRCRRTYWRQDIPGKHRLGYDQNTFSLLNRFSSAFP